MKILIPFFLFAYLSNAKGKPKIGHCGGGPACGTNQRCVNGKCQEIGHCGGGPACGTNYRCVNGMCQEIGHH
jgi:hypothetical protein